VSLPPADPSLLDAAVEMIREAGKLTLQWFDRHDLAIDRKGDGTPVTEADRAAERLIRERIASIAPDDTILGEEEEDHPGSSGRTWIIDPIDGTKAFTRGVPLYSNLLAIVDEHGPLVGVIGLPALDIIVYAGRGLGCHRNGERVHVSNRSEPSDCVLSTSGFTNWPEQSLLGVKRAGFQMRTWGDGYGYAMVACGTLDAMVDPEVSLWDIAPMPVILSEAGGRFTGTDGSDAVLVPGAKASGVASNGIIHDAVLRALTAD
jgi:histidinol-phosphatase